MLETAVNRKGKLTSVCHPVPPFPKTVRSSAQMPFDLGHAQVSCSRLARRVELELAAVRPPFL
jgi:hypothetical protein